MRFIPSTVLAFAVASSPLRGQQSVEYDVSFPNAAQHEARVVAVFRGVPAGKPLEAKMSVSSPGRYARTSFAKNVYDVTAVDGRGRSLGISRPDTHGWTVRGHDGTVRLTYTAWGDRTDGTYLGIDHSHAHMNMPAAFMFARGMETAPITLKVNLPDGWKIATQLIATSDANVFTAPGMQWFMDSPTEVGPLTFRSWTEQHGTRRPTWRIALHHLGTEAELDSLTSMIRKVVDETIAMWGEPAAYDHGVYTFILDYLPWARGDGMEHRNSTILTSATPISSGASRLSNLGSISHEFFHSWNMERLRAKAIEPFDFDGENMSSELWFGEGFTSYYGPLMIRRAGLYSDDEWAALMGSAVIRTIESPAGRHGSPADMSRMAPLFDGGSYVDPTNRQNTFLSYYTWGSAVALALDLTLRERYGTTLDEYMRKLWRDYGTHQSAAFAPERPYTMTDLRAALGAVARDTAFANDFFRRYIEGSEVPDFSHLLEPAGFALLTDSIAEPYLGASLDNDSMGVFVNWSQEGGSTYDAGIASGDVILAVNRIPSPNIDSLSAIIARQRVGDVVQVDVIGRQVRRTVPMKIAGRRATKLVTFESIGRAVTPEIARFRVAWLGSRQTTTPPVARSSPAR